MSFGHKKHHWKNQIIWSMFHVGSGFQKKLPTIIEGQNFFCSKYGNIYVKRCIFKYVRQGKKAFQKIFTVSWFTAKKLAKKALNCKITVFCQFFGHKSCYSKDFLKCFFSWLTYLKTHLLKYILPYLEQKIWPYFMVSNFFLTQNHHKTCFKWADFFSGAFYDQKTWEKL